MKPRNWRICICTLSRKCKWRLNPVPAMDSKAYWTVAAGENRVIVLARKTWALCAARCSRLNRSRTSTSFLTSSARIGKSASSTFADSVSTKACASAGVILSRLPREYLDSNCFSNRSCICLIGASIACSRAAAFALLNWCCVWTGDIHLAASVPSVDGINTTIVTQINNSRMSVNRLSRVAAETMSPTAQKMPA